MLEKYELILVDLYNTLIRNKTRLHPYKYLYKEIIRKHSYIEFNSREFFDYAMTKNKNVRELLQYFNVSVEMSILEDFDNKLKQELESIIYNEDLINKLKKVNCPVCLVSNLSKEYSAPLEILMEKINFEKNYLSYEINILKPNKRLFELIAQDYKDIEKDKIIIIGDSLVYEGKFAENNEIDFQHIKKWW